MKDFLKTSLRSLSSGKIDSGAESETFMPCPLESLWIDRSDKKVWRLKIKHQNELFQESRDKVIIWSWSTSQKKTSWRVKHFDLMYNKIVYYCFICKLTLYIKSYKILKNLSFFFLRSYFWWFAWGSEAYNLERVILKYKW